MDGEKPLKTVTTEDVVNAATNRPSCPLKTVTTEDVVNAATNRPLKTVTTEDVVNAATNRPSCLLKTVTTEDVVNAATNKPSCLFALLMFGLMSFSTMNAMVAFFPNFGGYFPYSEWRCNVSSTACTSRTSSFTEMGWNNVTEESAIFLESRCSVLIMNVDMNEASVDLMGMTKSEIGKITLKPEDGELSITSDPTCDEASETCAATVTGIEFGEDFEGLSISFKFYVDKNTYSVNGADEVDLPQVYCLKDAINTVRYIKLDNIIQYDLSCPDPMSYNSTNLCGVEGNPRLELIDDFYWYSQGRTSFTKDFDLLCGRQTLHSLLSSIYFAGALFGASIGGTLHDIIGRKRSGLIGYGIVIISSFAVSASPVFEFFLLCRFFQGVGVAVGLTGMIVRLMEITASKYRAPVNSSAMLFWSVGYLLIVLTGYVIKSWNWLAATIGFLYFIALVPMLFVPESPRFLLVNKKDEKAAKESLRWIIKMNNSDYDIDSVTLRDVVEEKQEELGIVATIKDFFKYRELVIQLGLQMSIWMITAFIYYGFTYSWRFFGTDIYSVYLYAAVGELIAYGGMTFPIIYLGRKFANITFYSVGTLSFLLALIPGAINGFPVSNISSLFGSMFISAAWGSTYLFTIELSPTTHRGKMLGYCSFAATIGSICGPYAPELLDWNRSVALVIFAILAAMACMCNFRLPRTKGIPIPNTAEEVQMRANGIVNVGVEMGNRNEAE